MAWWTTLFAQVQDLSVDEMVLAVGRPPVVRRGTDLLTLGRSPLTSEQTRGNEELARFQVVQGFF